LLVDSYRATRGPRQRQIAYFDEMDTAEHLGVNRPSRIIPVTRLLCWKTTSRWFGEVWLALELIKKLQLDRFFQEALTSAHAKISWAHLSTVLVAARFCKPKSELHLAAHF
jgi:hypothetical protein